MYLLTNIGSGAQTSYLISESFGDLKGGQLVKVVLDTLSKKVKSELKAN